jgi:polyferredoxin
VVIYPLVLTIVLSAFVVALARRGEADLEVLRARGAPYIRVDEHLVANQVKVKIVNRSVNSATFTLSAESAAGTPGVELHAEDNPVTLAPGEVRTVPVQVVAPAASFERGALDVRVRVRGGEKFDGWKPIRLMGPARTHIEEPDKHEEGDG